MDVSGLWAGMLDKLATLLDPVGMLLTGALSALGRHGAKMSSFEVLLIAALGLIALSLLIVALTLFLHDLRVHRTSRHQAFNKAWEPILFARMMGDVVDLPKLAARDRLWFFLLWNRLHGHVSAEAADELNRCVADLNIAKFARSLLHWRADWKRMLGLMCAIRLHDPASASRLFVLAMRDQPAFNHAATRALLSVDSPLGQRALRHVLLNTDWFAPAMAELVRAGGPRALAELEATIQVAEPKRARRLVRVIEALDDFAALPILRDRLPAAVEPEEIAGILHAFGRLGSSEDRRMILQHVAAQSWLVRMECARGLGRIGLPQDADVVLQLARDAAWWVRYRAVQSLIALVGMDATAALSSSESDRFTRDMMLHVLAESAA